MERVTIVAVLVLSQVILLSAFPFWPPPTEEPVQNSTEEGSGGSGEEEEGEKQPSAPAINNYVLNFFLHQRELKEKNCSTQFLGQSISRHLCNSSRVIFLFPEGPEYNETATPQNKYELCLSEEHSGAGQILGYDIVLYMRHSDANSSSAETRSVFIIETIGDLWQQMLGEKTIPRDTAAGWQVFHLSERVNTDTQFCVNIHVLDRQRGLLNRSSIGEMFVLDKTRPHELDKQPLLVKYTRKQQSSVGVSPFVPSPDPFPFFGQSFTGSTAPPLTDQPTSPPTESRDKRSSDDEECTVEENPVNLSHYNVVAPGTIDIGRCSGEVPRRVDIHNKHIGPAEEKYEQQSLEGTCSPIEYDDLYLLSYSQLHSAYSMETLPNAIVKKCGRMPLP